MKQIPVGYMEDSQGRLVPVEMVAEVDKTRDELVREICRAAKKLNEALRSFKHKAMGDIEAFVSLSAEKYNVNLGGQKGNIVLRSFDGRYKVMRVVADRLVFDERLNAAKELIDECLRDWTETAGPELKAIITDAFAVDKHGRINTQRILGLRRLEIKDDRWKRAMEAISDSLLTSETTTYVRCYERDATGSYQQITLDIARV